MAKNTKSRDEANSALSERVAEPAKAQLDEKALAKAAKAKARAVAKAEVEQASRDLKAVRGCARVGPLVIVQMGLIGGMHCLHPAL